MISEIGRNSLEAAVSAGGVTVIDALPAAPYGKRHLPGAINLTAEDPDARVAEVLPDRTAPIVIYSTDRDCARGPEMAARLSALGYADVRAYRAGIGDWVAAGLPLDQPTLARFALAELARSPTAALFEGQPLAGVDASIFVTRTPPGQAVGLHVHPYAETFLLLAGRARWTIGDEVVELGPEEIVVATPDTPHGFRNLGSEPLLVVSVHERGTLRQEWLDRDPA